MKIKSGLLFLIGVLLPVIANGQVSRIDSMKAANIQSFDDFKKKQTEAFENYKQKKQLEFARFLEQKWEEFTLFAGREPIRMPEPVEPPIAPTLDSIPDVEMPTLPDVLPPPKEEPLPLPDLPAIPEDVEYKKVHVEFLGHKLTLNYDITFAVALPQITEDKVAEYWTRLAKGSFEELTYQCLLIKKELRLNDWGYYLFIRELANQLYASDRKNEKIAFAAFILDNSGYMVRMARDANYKNLLLLLSIEDEVYEKSFFTLSGKTFYLVDGEKTGSIYTYNEWQESDRKKPINLVIKDLLKVSGQHRTEVVKNQSLGGDIEIEYDADLKEFYDRMPMCNLSVVFNSECSENVSNSLKTQLAGRLMGKSKTEQVAKLLSFIHEGFPYMTDDTQFGREKYFFYEEAFIYPDTDCEDNSVLFSYLVRKLTGLKVVGLLYSDHAAAAVKFDEEIEGHFIMHKGEKYIICDPTYFGARIGQCMPDYQTQSAKIIEIQ